MDGTQFFTELEKPFKDNELQWEYNEYDQQKYCYVNIAKVIERANMACASKGYFSFAIINDRFVGVNNEWFTVMCRLSFTLFNTKIDNGHTTFSDGPQKFIDQYGGAKMIYADHDVVIKKNGQDKVIYKKGDMVNPHFVMKSAVADAFKKAAMYFGIGRYLMEKETYESLKAPSPTERIEMPIAPPATFQTSATTPIAPVQTSVPNVIPKALPNVPIVVNSPVATVTPSNGKTTSASGPILKTQAEAIKRILNINKVDLADFLKSRQIDALDKLSMDDAAEAIKVLQKK